MPNVLVKFRDGTEKVHKEDFRTGGSYTQTVTYESGVVIIVDVWGGQTIYPLDLVESVHVQSGRR
jgi:hypothetical protein